MATPTVEPERVTKLAVRELCEFTAKRGDLDLRFTPSPTSQQGIEGHKEVASRRGQGYSAEVRLESSYRTLRLSGRADGIRDTPITVEEVKTYRGRLDRLPENHRELHWAQLKMYGAQVCQERLLETITLSLVYFNIDTQKELSLTEVHTAIDLQFFYTAHCDRFIAWDELQQVHKAQRDDVLRTVAFPHSEFHAGQRLLAEAVYRSILKQKDLLAQAPTGIGKSIGTLFPALKAMAAGHLDKIYFLTAKTSGRELALKALASLKTGQGTAIPLRVLELVARDKACEHPDKACHGESCPLAKGFYDRLPAARAAASENNNLHQASLRQVALRHQVCPYYLSQEMTRWSDVIVGDYNYYLDQSALLHSLTVVNDWRVVVLIDEAHNLVDRGRAMYTATLDQRAVLAQRKFAAPLIQKALTRLNSAWSKATRDQVEEYRTYGEPLPSVVQAMQKAVAALGEYFLDHPEEVSGDVKRLYFDLLVFLQLVEQFGEHSLFDVQVQPSNTGRAASSVLCIRNVVPAPFLSPRFETATSVIAFSATLNPPYFYKDLIGLPLESGWVDVPSPFKAEQVELQVVDQVSTRYRDRASSIAPVAEIIATRFQERPGNYLAFFSSFEYLRQVHGHFLEHHPDVPLWAQDSKMKEVDRNAFLDRFTETGKGVGFAVLGGVFAEGIDLPGQRLIGVFIATLGLPQINAINEEMRKRMEALYSSGYDYTYFYPGLRKVVQAAGRVIRTPKDKGLICLIDDRFGHARTQKLFPAWWPSSTGRMVS